MIQDTMESLDEDEIEEEAEEEVNKVLFQITDGKPTACTKAIKAYLFLCCP